MISNGLAALLQKRGIHYGWVVAGTTFLVMLATAGAMGSAGVLIQPLRDGIRLDHRADLLGLRRAAVCSSACSAPSPPPS